MPDITALAKLAGDLGGLGVALAVIIFAGYGVRAGVGLAREYAPQMIVAHQSQTDAIRQLSESIGHAEQQITRAVTDTAQTTRDMMDDQRETLIVMRSISAEIRELREESRAADVEFREGMARLRRSVEGKA